MVKQRTEHLRSKIAKHKPQVVVFYGLSYQRHWEDIAAVEFQDGEPMGVRYGSDGKTLFVIAKHSTARGVTNEYFDNIGRRIAGRLSKLTS